MGLRMTVELRTERLLLRRWSGKDREAIAEMDADPEVMRYIGDGSVRDPELAGETIERFERLWDEQGFGLFAVEWSATGELAGWTGLAVPSFLPEVLPAVEIGWRLRREFQGRGIATEAARESMRFGFEEAGLDRLVSIHHPDNTASARVMEKIGLRFDRETSVPKFGRRARVTAITREQYSAP